MRVLATALLSFGLAAGTPPPVVLELFTSEGCSSCPPADELLLRLEQEPGVIALGFHVDYWDDLGWKDPFSKHAFTERQFAYARAFRQASAYTPELVVDGRRGVVGSSESDARRAIAQARGGVKLPLRLEEQDGSLRISLEQPAERPMDLLLALTESGLESAVLRGENQGRRLRHGSVVRHLVRRALTVGVHEATIDVDPIWRRDHLRAVALLQDPNSLAILGAQTLVF